MLRRNSSAFVFGCAIVIFVLNAVSTAFAAGNGSSINGRVPLYFEQNVGQTSGDVQFVARANGYTAFLTRGETVLHFRSGTAQKGEREAIVRMKLSGSQTPSIRGGERLPGVVNYLIGNNPSKWQTKIPTYADVHYDKVYPGIDLVYRPAGKELEFDFHVDAGVSAEPIRMTYSGATKMHLDGSGNLVLETNAGSTLVFKPVAYQEIGEKRVMVAADYSLLPNGEVGFHLGEYDHNRPLVIDPTIGPSTYYATYVGTGSNDTFTSIAVNAAGEAFLTGYTTATNYPTGAESGYLPYRSTYPSAYADNYTPVGFVTALNAAGTGIIYSTFISGTSSTASTGASLNAIAVNSSGNAFVAGQTDDSTFPVQKAFQATYPTSRLAAYGIGNSSAVVFELSPNGDSLVYSSFLGGGDNDSGTAIAIDSSNNAYVTGTNQVGYYYQAPSSTLYYSGFPVTSGVVWGRYPQGNIGSGFTSAFATKIAPPTSGSASLVYSTVIGVADSGEGYGSNMPSTYGKSIAVDSTGNAYIAGTTNCDIGTNHSGISKTLKMSVSLGWSGCYSYGNQAWVVELNPTATSAPYLAYLGGSTPSVNDLFGSPGPPNTSLTGITADGTGKVYVVGTTQANNFQTTSGAYRTTSRLAGVTNTSGTQSDGYITSIAAGGASFSYSTYLNGSTISSAATNGSPTFAGIALGTGGQFAVAGTTSTTDFPASGSVAGPLLSTTYPGCSGSCARSTAFLTKFDSSGLVYSVFLGAGQESASALASNGTDMYVMFREPSNGLATGGAYDSDNSGAAGAKVMITRVQDALAVATTMTVDDKTALNSASDQTVSLTSSINAASNVNAGVVTYTVTDSGSATIGSPVTSDIVSAGIAPAVGYTLPGGTATGYYTIHANYVGAGGFLNSTGTGTLVVGTPKVDTTTTLTSSVNPTLYGQSITFTAAVSSSTTTPTGTVAFSDNGTLIGTATLNASGQATFTTTALSVASHPITAQYSGDADFNTSDSAALSQVVNKANSTTTVSSNASTSVFGQSVTFTATVSDSASGAVGAATGTVTFYDSGTPIGTGTPNTSGQATFTTSSLSVATHNITAGYGGDGNFNTSTSSTLQQTVNQANSTAVVTSSTLTSVYGQSVTFTATVTAASPGSGSPSGTVTFYDNGSSVGAGVLNVSGQATLTTSTLGITTHPITVVYGGDANFKTSTSAVVSQVVNKANTTTTVTSSTNPSIYKQSVSFTATVTVVAPGVGTPTGTVTFLDGGTPIGTGNLSTNVASFTTTDLSVANHTITASYAGDNNFNNSTGSLVGNPQVVSAVPTTTTLSPGTANVVYGQPFTLTSYVSLNGTTTADAPAGTVTATNNTTGQTYTGTLVAAVGPPTYSTAAITVNSPLGVTGSPYNINAKYNGSADGNYSASSNSNSVTVVVNRADTTTTLTSSASTSTYGQSVTFTATLAVVAPGTGTPSGNATFYDNGTAIGSGALNGSGVASLTISTLTAGNHNISASYGGSANFNTSSTIGSLSQTVNKAIASVTPNPATKVYGTGEPSLTGTLTGFVASDNVTASYSRVSGETVAGGPYTISATLSPSGVLGNYDITYNTANFTISKATASVTPTATSKTYGTSEPSLMGTLTGFVASDNVTASYSRVTGETVAGGPYLISATLSPTGVLSNYDVTYNTANFTISKATASVTPTTTSKTYGTSDPSLTGTLSGFVAADGVTATYSRTSGESVSSSPYSISATLSPALALGNYDITYNTANFTISKATASVTPDAAAKTYGASDPSLTGTLSGFLAADGVTATYSRTAGESVGSSPYTISASLAPASVLGNYNITYNTANFTISKAAASVTPNASSKVYGASDPTLTGALSGFLASDNVTATYARTSGETVGGSPYAISATLSPASVLANYNITYDTANFTISKAAASVTPNPASKVYGTNDPVLTGTLSGFVAADGVTATYSRAAGDTVAGGPYLISATLSPSGVLSNYDITYNTANFNVTKATTTATLQTNAATVMRMSDVTLTAHVTSTNGVPTGTVNFLDGSTTVGSASLDNTGTATLTLNTLAAGTRTLTAAYAGDSNFNISTSSTVSQTVQDFALTVSGSTSSSSSGSATVKPGGTVTYRIQLSPVNGSTFIAPVTLSLTGLPAGATYTVTPSSIAAGSGAQTITVQVQVPSVNAGARRTLTGSPLFALGLLPVFGILHLRRSGKGRKKLMAITICMMVAVLMLSISACGGSGFLNQPPQTYNLQLTGTSGALQHVTSLTLTVQ